MNRYLLWLTCGLLIAGTSTLDACPFCLAPLQTWSEIIDEADVVCLAKLISVDEGSDQRNPHAMLEVTRIHKGTRFHRTDRIRVERYLSGKPGALFLMTGRMQEDLSGGLVETFATDADGNTVTESKPDSPIRKVAATDADTSNNSLQLVFQWNDIEATTTDRYNYMTSAPSPKSDDRLLYFLPFLEHADTSIASDAWGEFANADYQTIRAIRSEFPPEKLRKWIGQSNTSPERLGLYGMMLGLCGDTDDAAFLRKHIIIGSTDELRYGIEGLMAGLMLIRGEEGLSFIESQVIQTDVEGRQIFAVMQALKFVWSYESDLISKDRLRAALHPLLKHESVRELAIRDLSRWEDWSAISKLETVYEEAIHNDRSTVVTITRFLMSCEKSASANETQKKDARELLDRILAAQPDLDDRAIR